MIRRLISATVLVAAIAPGAAAEFLERWSLNFNAGTVLALNGRYDGATRLNQMVLPGSGMGLSIKYNVGRRLILDAAYSYNWLFVRKARRPEDYVADKPAMVLPLYTLNVAYVLSPGRNVRPFVTLGGGLAPWWFSSQAFKGTLWTAPAAEANFSKISPLLNGGLGIELGLWSHISISCEARYSWVFAKDEDRFGTGVFTDQGILGVRLGITYHFGRRNTSNQPEE